jgi:hypothetical protein
MSDEADQPSEAPDQAPREEAIAGLRRLGWPLPEGWRFDRQGANAR